MSIFKSGNSSESKIESVNGCKITGVASAQKTGNVAVTLKMIFFTLWKDLMCARNKCSKITQCLKKSIFEEKNCERSERFSNQNIWIFALKIERKIIEKIKKNRKLNWDIFVTFSNTVSCRRIILLEHHYDAMIVHPLLCVKFKAAERTRDITATIPFSRVFTHVIYKDNSIQVISSLNWNQTKV